MSNKAPLLELVGVSKNYGPVRALSNVDFKAYPGRIHAILGENGAGKSTLMKLISGAIRPSEGKLTFAGKTTSFSSTAEAATLGIVCMFQELSLMPSLTVGDNIILARRTGKFGILSKSSYVKARAALDRIGADDIALDTPVQELTLAQRQLVEIAKAIYQEPKFLILDEATSALGASATEKVFSVIRELRDDGCAILFISHRFHEVESLSEEISVFRAGKHINTFKTGEFDRNEIVNMMIGERMEELFPPKRPTLSVDAAPVLQVSNLSFEKEIFDISLSVRAGEIFGLGGLDGQGQQAIPQAIFGCLRGTSGEIKVDGKPYAGRSPFVSKQGAQAIAFVPEDRKTEGMIQSLSIADNLRLAGHGVSGDRCEREKLYRELLDRLELTYGDLDDPVSSLSGGNQQKVLLAKWLALNPRCILLLDPTRGIDVKTKLQIYRLLDELARSGVAILLQSTDYEELVNLCDRVAVVYAGRITRELAGETLTPANLVSAALGLTTNIEERQSA